MKQRVETTSNKKVHDCFLCKEKIDIFIRGAFDIRFGLKGNFDIYKCNFCGLVQLGSYPIISEYNKLYETYYNFGSSKRGLYTTLRMKFIESKFYRIWMAIDGDISFHSRRGEGRLLDVGCNEGRGIKTYKQNGFEPEGLEINERAAQVARMEGFVVHTQRLEDFQPEEPFGVVVLSNVLEHASDPYKMLENVRRVLKADGHVWISCPNSQSWLRRFFGRFWINWHVPFHLFHFSQKTLSQLLDRSGFKVKKLKFVTPCHWLTQSIIAAIFAKPGRETRQLRNPLLVAFLMIFCQLFFPLLCFSNLTGHGDCLVVEAVPRNKS